MPEETAENYDTGDNNYDEPFDQASGKTPVETDKKETDETSEKKDEETAEVKDEEKETEETKDKSEEETTVEGEEKEPGKEEEKDDETAEVKDEEKSAAELAEAAGQKLLDAEKEKKPATEEKKETETEAVKDEEKGKETSPIKIPEERYTPETEAYLKEYEEEGKVMKELNGLQNDKLVNLGKWTHDIVINLDTRAKNLEQSVADLLDINDELQLKIGLLQEGRTDAFKIAVSTEFTGWLGKQSEAIKILGRSNNPKDANALMRLYEIETAKVATKEHDEGKKKKVKKFSETAKSLASSRTGIKKEPKADEQDHDASFAEAVAERKK